MKPISTYRERRIVRFLATMLLLLLCAPGFPMAPPSTGTGGTAAEAEAERMLRLSLKIATAKGQHRRVSLYGSVARQRKLRDEGKGTRGKTSAVRKRVRVTVDPAPSSAR